MNGHSRALYLLTVLMLSVISFPIHLKNLIILQLGKFSLKGEKDKPKGEEWS